MRSPSLLLALIVLSLVPGHLRGATAAEKIGAGRAALVAHDLVTAKTRFAEALALEPANQSAAALLGCTRYFALINQSSTQALLDRGGLAAAGRDLYAWTSEPTRDPDGQVVVSTGFNLDEVFVFWRDTLVPEAEQARGNLALVTDPGFTLTLQPAETMLPDPVTVDFGDILTIRAGLRATEFGAHFFRGQNTTADLSVIQDLMQGNLLTVQRLLSEHPDLLKPGSPAERVAARSALIETIQLYRQASEFIRARPAGLDRLFMLEAADLADEADLRGRLVSIERSLDSFVNYIPEEQDGSSVLVNLAPLFGAGHSIRAQLPATRRFDPFGAGDLSLGGVVSGLTREAYVSAMVNEWGFQADLGWQWVTPTPDGNTLTSAAYGNNLYLLAGGGGTVKRSTDGTTWTTQQIPELSGVTSLAFCNGQFTALTPAGIRRSSDGVSWVPVNGLREGLQVVPAGSGLAMISPYAEFASASDGLNWTQGGNLTDPAAGVSLRYLLTLTYGNGLYVATGMDGVNFYGHVLTSPDGITWTRRISGTGWTPGAMIPCSSVAYGNGRFVVVGWSNLLLTSTNGINWTPGTVLASGALTFSNLVFDGARFIALGSNGTLATSVNGLTWSPVAAPSAQTLSTLATANGHLWAFGGGGLALHSTNASTFTAFGSTATSGIPQTTSLNQLRTLGGKLFAAGSAGGIYVSTDGTTFTPATTGTTNAIWDLAEHGGTYVAVGDGGTILTSATGSAWTAQTSGVTDHLRTVAYLNDRFVAAGDNGRLLTSPTGSTWTSRLNQGSGYTFLGLTYGAGTYAAAGSCNGSGGSWGPVATSTDGSFWTPNNGVYLPLGSIEYDAGQFWALHERGSAWGAGTAFNWTYYDHTDSETPGVLHLLGGRWTAFQLAGGETGKTRTSVSLSAGLGSGSWIPCDTPASTGALGLAWFGGRYYVTGGSGSILRSSAVPAVVRPTLFADPISRTAVVGTTVGFSAGITGEAVLGYQWYKNGAPLAGATGPELVFLSVQPADAGLYRVLVLNSAGSVQSGAATLAVSGAPFVTVQPADQLGMVGQGASFSVAAVGAPAVFTYRWQRQPAGSATWSDLSDAGGFGGTATPTLTIDSLTAALTGDRFRCVVTNGVAPAATSAAATLTVQQSFAGWQVAGFTAAELDDPLVSGPLVVLGPDSATNLLKYALGVPPRSAIPAGAQVVTPPAVPGSPAEWTFTYRRPANRADLDYRVEYSPDFATWSGSGMVHERIATADANGMETWGARVTTAAGRLFFHLRVTVR